MSVILNLCHNINACKGILLPCILCLVTQALDLPMLHPHHYCSFHHHHHQIHRSWAPIAIPTHAIYSLPIVIPYLTPLLSLLRPNSNSNNNGHLHLPDLRIPLFLDTRTTRDHQHLFLTHSNMSAPIASAPPPKNPHASSETEQ